MKQIAVTQIDDLLARFEQESDQPKAIHETRKTIKRLRALLSLVRHGLSDQDLRRERERLRAIAHAIAGARDAHVRVETAAKLETPGMHSAARATSRKLMTLMKNKRNGAHTDAQSSAISLPVAALEEARNAFRSLAVDQLTFDHVVKSFTATYRLGRKRYAAVREADAGDESFHDLRKAVQQHWRHLQLLSPVWPKALRPQIALARELSETLGEDHDIAVLAHFARERADKLGQAKALDTYLALCADRQQELRRYAGLLARRLYAEKPKALRQRITVYWETAEGLSQPKAEQPGSANVVAPKR